MVDVFDEVEGELRAQRAADWARRYLPWAVLGLVIGLLVILYVALNMVWHGWQDVATHGIPLFGIEAPFPAVFTAPVATVPAAAVPEPPAPAPVVTVPPTAAAPA